MTGFTAPPSTIRTISLIRIVTTHFKCDQRNFIISQVEYTRTRVVIRFQIKRDQNYSSPSSIDMVTPYTHQYMTNVLAPRSESSTASQAYSDTTKKNTALVFKIPVYKNMPDSACELPTGEGSPNNALTSLSVSGYSLTPTFDMFTTEYGVSSISVFSLHSSIISLS